MNSLVVGIHQSINKLLLLFVEEYLLFNDFDVDEAVKIRS